MTGTLSDVIIDAHLIDDEEEGGFVRVKLDAVLGHDATIALLVDEFRKRKLQVWDRDRVLFVNDHFSPAASIERANISRKFIGFARETGVRRRWR